MNSVIEKILVNELNSRFDTTKEGNNKLRKISRMYNTELKGEVWKDNLVTDPDCEMKHYNIYLIGIPLTETRKNGRGTIFKMIIADSFFQLQRTSSHMLEAYTKKGKTQKSTSVIPMYIFTWDQNVSGKGKTLVAACNGTPVKLAADSSSAVYMPEDSWINIFSVRR